MRKIIGIPVGDVVPSAGAVLRAQGVPRTVAAKERMTRLAQDSISVYRELADPVGVVADISCKEFEAVYRGEGRNAKETPLGPIYTSSHSLALYATTIGAPVCGEISRLFKEDEFVKGTMLDAAASEGTELTAQAVESFHIDRLKESGRMDTSAATMLFSPGYCGWHVSGQKRLFESLRPDEIGIELSESFLMQPLKSVSGVIVVGPREIFDFDDAFSFCDECSTHSCRDRIRTVLER